MHLIAVRAESSALVGAAYGVAGVFCIGSRYPVARFRGEIHNDAVAAYGVEEGFRDVVPRERPSAFAHGGRHHLCCTSLRMPAGEDVVGRVLCRLFGCECGGVRDGCENAFPVAVLCAPFFCVYGFPVAVRAPVFCKQAGQGAVHFRPSSRMRCEQHLCVEEYGPRSVVPGTSQQELAALLLCSEDAAAVEDVAVGQACLCGRSADDVALAFARSHHYVAAVEVDRASAADEVHRALHFAAFQICGAACVGVVCVLIAEKRDVREDIPPATPFAQRHGAVGEGLGVCLVVRPQFDALYVCAVGLFDEQRGRDADTLVLRHGFYQRQLHSLPADAGVGCRECGDGARHGDFLSVCGHLHGRAVSLAAVLSGADEYAVAPLCVGPLVGGLYGGGETPAVRHDEVVAAALRLCSGCAAAQQRQKYGSKYFPHHGCKDTKKNLNFNL